MLSCSERTMRSSPARLRRFEILPQLRELCRQLAFVHRVQKPIERGLREQEAQEEPEQPVEARRPDFLGGAGVIARCAADAGGDAAHLEAARVQAFEARARIGRQPAEHRHQRQRRRLRGGGLPIQGAADGVHFRVDRRAEARKRDQARSNRSALQPQPAATTRRAWARSPRAAAAPRKSNRFHRKRKASFR